MKHELKKIGILSAGKIIGLLYGILMLLMVPFSLIFIVLGIVTAVQGKPEGYGMVGMGVFFLFSPLLYAALGFVFGALGALVYNLISKKWGGLVFETAPKD